MLKKLSIYKLQSSSGENYKLETLLREISKQMKLIMERLLHLLIDWQRVLLGLVLMLWRKMLGLLLVVTVLDPLVLMVLARLVPVALDRRRAAEGAGQHPRHGAVGLGDVRWRGAHGQRTVGGSEDRIEATLPPVLRPKIVPRS